MVYVFGIGMSLTCVWNYSYLSVEEKFTNTVGILKVLYTFWTGTWSVEEIPSIKLLRSLFLQYGCYYRQNPWMSNSPEQVIVDCLTLNRKGTLPPPWLREQVIRRGRESLGAEKGEKSSKEMSSVLDKTIAVMNLLLF